MGDVVVGTIGGGVGDIAVGYVAVGDVGVYNFRPSVRPIPMQIHIQVRQRP